MIPDGYTLGMEVNGGWVEYRPLTLRLRGELLRRLQLIPIHHREQALRCAAATRIQEGFREYAHAVTLGQVKQLIGMDRGKEEFEDKRNLARGVVLAEKFPWLQKTSCETCREFWFNPLTGRFTSLNSEQKPNKREGPVLCEFGKCPAGHYARPVRLSPKNELAFEFHKQCREAGSFPDDPIVRENARIIESVIARCRKSKRSSPS